MKTTFLTKLFALSILTISMYFTSTDNHSIKQNAFENAGDPPKPCPGCII